jgi:Fe-S-cluster containining protein
LIIKKMGSKEKQIRDLSIALDAAKRLSSDQLAKEISDIGFKCQNCSECCHGEDNSVVVFPFEIRKILTATKLNWLEVVQPPKEGEWDSSGCFHTLEWRLRKEGVSCLFLQDNRCSIYENRPMLCGTYPFYLNQGILQCSECMGLGSVIDPEDAKRIAMKLLERYITEILEAISLLEKYEDFERGRPRESGKCIVHDSEGKHCVYRAFSCHK